MESRESPDDLEVVSTTIRIAEVSTKMFEEKVDYPFGELISEIGGSLGVFLGLRYETRFWPKYHSASIIDVVVFGREVLKRLQRITMLIFRRLKTQCARKTQPTSPSTISSPSSLTMNSKRKSYSSKSYLFQFLYQLSICQAPSKPLIWQKYDSSETTFWQHYKKGQ